MDRVVLKPGVVTSRFVHFSDVDENVSRVLDFVPAIFLLQ